MTKLLVPLLALLCLLPDLPSLGWRAVPTWAALLAGIAVTLILGNPWAARTKPLTPRLLAWSVMGLGAAMNLRTVAVVGLQGFGYTLVGIACTLGLAALLGKWLAVRRATGILVGVGTAICGGSAIAAAAPVIGAEDEDTSAALGIVFLLNATALLLFPPIGHRLHLTQHAFGLWAALAIHDTSSVVGASATYGAEALMVATTTKLVRALWIVPVTLALGALVARHRSEVRTEVKTKRPWFILGFLVAAALVSFVPSLRPAGHIVALAAQRLLVLTLMLLGLGLSRTALARVGARPFLMGLSLWLVVGSATLGAVLLGWIG
ncbi:MAG: YeiH family protein [Myxococcaceae bacterium]